jgi:hypothetical protein
VAHEMLIHLTNAQYFESDPGIDSDQLSVKRSRTTSQAW